MNASSQNPGIRDLDSWTKEELFNPYDSSNLTEKIRVIAALRETNLGVDDSRTPFNPEVYAKVVISWVKGQKLKDVANFHPAYNVQDITEPYVIEDRITDFIKKMNDIRFKTSWGLSALEGVVRGNEDIKDSHIPSLVYFGVDNEKSLALRMVGVPRELAFSMKDILTEDLNQYSFKDIRNRIQGLNNADWDNFKPANSKLSGEEWKRISEILVK